MIGSESKRHHGAKKVHWILDRRSLQWQVILPQACVEPVKKNQRWMLMPRSNAARMLRPRGTRDTVHCTAPRSPRDVGRGTIWTDGILHFRNSGISEIRNSGNREIRSSGNSEFRTPDLQNSGIPDFRREIRISGFPEFRMFGDLEIRISGFPEFPELRKSGIPAFRKSGNSDVSEFWTKHPE